MRRLYQRATCHRDDGNFEAEGYTMKAPLPKAATKKPASTKPAPKKSSPKRGAPKNAAPKKPIPKKVAPKKPPSTKAAPKKAAPKKPTPKKPGSKRAVSDTPAKKRKPRKRRPPETLATGYELREPERVAGPSIEGYWYQILHTAREWLDLDPTTILIAEGNEDLDLTSPLPTLSASVPTDIETQIKHRCAPIAQGDSAISMTILRYLVAFAHHHQNSRRFAGVLRTNADIAADASSEIGRWIVGSPVRTAALLTEIKAVIVHEKKTDRKRWRAALNYVTSNGLEQNFVDSVRWAPRSGSIEDIRRDIRERIAIRAPGAPSNILTDALLVRLVGAITRRALSERQLRAIDADIALGDGALEALQRGAARAASGGSVYVWSRKGTPFVACAIWVEHPDAIEAMMDVEARRDEIQGAPRPLIDRLGENIATIDFVAYVSIRLLTGPRGMRVCLRDVVRQARRRHSPAQVIAEEAAEQWLIDWTAKKWPTPMRRPPGNTGLALAEVVAESVVSIPRNARLVADIGSKLRWVHRVDDQTYWTAENPMPI